MLDVIIYFINHHYTTDIQQAAALFRWTLSTVTQAQFKCFVLRGCCKLSPFFGSFDLRGIWMKVVLGMTPWVIIKHLGPKNPRQPNLAASKMSKINFKKAFFDLFSEKSP